MCQAEDESIQVLSASANNLKDLNLLIPKARLTVLRGPSGSGKSSLLLGTIAKAGKELFEQIKNINRARFAPPEWARLNRAYVTNLPPTQKIDLTPRTHSTDTISSFLSLGDDLFSSVISDTPDFCETCQTAVRLFSLNEINNNLQEKYSGKNISIEAVLFKVIKGQQPSEAKLTAIIEECKRQGFSLLNISGEYLRTDEPAFDKHLKQILLKKGAFKLAAVIDRIAIEKDCTERLNDALQHAASLQRFGIQVCDLKSKHNLESYAINHTCNNCGSKTYRFSNEVFNLKASKAGSLESLSSLSPINSYSPNKRALLKHLKISDLSLEDFLTSPFSDLVKAEGLPLRVEHYLKLLAQLGLAKLHFIRPVSTLSRSEYLRLQLIKAFAEPISYSAYLIDNISRYFVEQDLKKIMVFLKSFTRQGITVVVADNSDSVLYAADHRITLGPDGGPKGGRLIEEEYAYAQQAISKRSEDRNTDKADPVKSATPAIYIDKAKLYDVKEFSLSIPLKKLCCITGPSGSGKYSLVFQIIHPAIQIQKKDPACFNPKVPRGSVDCFKVTPLPTKVLAIECHERTQSNNSIVATYLGLFKPICKFYSELNEAKIRGYTEKSFSLSSAKGSARCPVCKGKGYLVNDHPASLSIQEQCAECKGMRYAGKILDLRYKGLNIAEVLKLSLHDVLKLFSFMPSFTDLLDRLQSVNIDYASLGQLTSTLSFGERLKLMLARDLNPKASNILYLIDFPASGFLADEVLSITQLFKKVVANDNSIICVENNIHLLDAADFIITL